MYYGITVNVVCIAVIFAMLSPFWNKKESHSTKFKLLAFSLLCIAFLFSLDIPIALIDGNYFPGSKILMWILNTLYWLGQAVYCGIWMLFTNYYVFGEMKKFQKRLLIYLLPAIIEVAVILINPITKWVFTINQDNLYETGSGYTLNLIPFCICLINSVVLSIIGIIRSKENTIQRKRYQLFLILIFFPICEMPLEIYTHGINCTWPMIVVSTFVLFIEMQQEYIAHEHIKAAEEKEKAQKIEKELVKTREKILISQIQPHFLNNSLAVISALCETNPAAASQALGDFSDFLRGNLNSVDIDKPVTFEQELEHTEHYLALEKLRFGDLIKIDYDIKVKCFRLPALSLQPIVENAVKHGIRKRENGGVVSISTYETAKAYIVSVEDNGVGFDTQAQPSGDRTHIGLSNVSNRLKTMRGGTLTIESTPTVGTKVTITLPKTGDTFV